MQRPSRPPRKSDRPARGGPRERPRRPAGRSVLLSVFDTLGSHVAVLDRRGRIVAVNAAWRRFAVENGCPDPQAFVGSDYLAVCTRAASGCADAAEVAAGLRRVLDGRSDAFRIEYPCDSPDRRRRFQMHAARWPGPHPVRVVVSHLDVTDRRLAEEGLRDADRRKDEFLAMLAHELRNPLSPILNAVRLLERTEALTSRGEGALAMISRQVDHLTQLVDDLLDVSRIARGKIELRREPVDVGVAARRAVEAIAAEAAARRHRLELDLPVPAPWVDADPVRLAQMLGNLLGNACKYTPDGGRIELRVAATDDEVEIVVSDTGIGIEPDKIATLFVLFHQLDATLERSSGGLGIGLTVVRELAELHGGRVRARSEGHGRGATFVVTLPRRAPVRTEPVERGGRGAGG